MKQPSRQLPLGLALAIAVAMLFPSSAIAQNNAPKKTDTTSPVAATAKNSAHATESLNATGKAGATPSATVEYKDPEDMTTRYRPGNNKTATVPADSKGTLPATPPTGSPAATADTTKHIGNVKYNDKQVTIPALDAASKDAAKSKTAPPAGGASTGAQGASTAQDSKRANKVDSFTVKQ